MSTTAAPRKLGILLAHGGIHTPTCFDPAKARLEAAGFFRVIAVRYPSLGTDPTITMDDDARNTQSELSPHLEEGREFLCVAHSYGGTPMVAAVQGFSTADRKAKGKRGGIAAVVFITAVIPAARGGGAFDIIPSELDIMSVINGIVVGKPAAKDVLYKPDMSEEMANKYMAMWEPQSLAALAGPVTFCMEDLNISTYYILCEKDLCLSPALQQKIASTIPNLKRLLRNPGGHSAIITELEKFVEQLIEISEEVEGSRGFQQ
ncbi:Methylesterase 3 [Colletotrichum siamense]|nr:Methylesterase 3 [Colletotrichum siamense]